MCVFAVPYAGEAKTFYAKNCAKCHGSDDKGAATFKLVMKILVFGVQLSGRARATLVYKTAATIEFRQ
jgi:hypothetical protein